MKPIQIFQVWVETKTASSVKRETYYLHNLGDAARFVNEATKASNVKVLRVSSIPVYDWSEALDALEDNQTEKQTA